MEFYRSTEIKPYQSEQVRPYRSAPVQEYRSTRAQRYNGGGSIHVFTPAERAQMMENTRRSYPVIRGRGGGYSTCAPNCGYDYSRGRAAPTIYSPFHNYSPFGN